MSKKIAVVSPRACVACGACAHACPREAIAVWRGTWAYVSAALCIGCGLCEKDCPACAISIHARQAVSA